MGVIFLFFHTVERSSLADASIIRRDLDVGHAFLVGKVKLGPLKLSQSLLLLNTMKLLLEASWKISHVQNQVVSLDNLPQKVSKKRV